MANLKDLLVNGVTHFIGKVYAPTPETGDNSTQVATTAFVVEKLNGKVDLNFNNMNPSQVAKNTIVGWGTPDYSAAISLPKVDGVTEANGILIFNGASNALTNGITIGGSYFVDEAQYYNTHIVVFPVSKGTSYSCTNWSAVNTFRLIPFKGAN